MPPSDQPKKCDARRVDVDGGRIAVEIERRHRARERDEVRRALAQVVARGQRAGEIDEVLAGGIGDAVRSRRRVVLFT